MSRIEKIAISSIVPDLNQPRKDFDEVKIRELAQTIRDHGLLTPILVRPVGNEKYQLVNGERRFKACRLVGFKTIKAEIRELSDIEALQIQLVENLQREDLNPVEEAETFQRLIKEFGYTHKTLAKRIGKSREYITNKLSLLRLPDNIVQAISTNEITESHARILRSLSPGKQKEVLREVANNRLNVRETKELVDKHNRNVSRETSANPEEKKLLIPISSRVYNILSKVAHSLKIKPEELLVRAILAFIDKEEVKT